MTAEIPTLPSQYDPHNTESKWQQTWFDQEVFRANPEQSGESFCIVILPPNVTGKLRMGHAFQYFTSLIDTIVRYHRMKEENVLCILDTDHVCRTNPC